jgi:serine/threonine protein kinase
MAPSLSSIRVVPAAGQATVTGVGKYRYIAMLAEGGMADVYLAVTQSAGFEKLVVIKQLRDSLAEDPTFVAMFMDEARLAARLNHPNVVQTLEVGTDTPTGLHFIAMEFLEGVAHVRFARLKERVPPPLAFAVRILVDVLRGLHYAHELTDFNGSPLNVVHRDVSPQNVMLTFAGGVKVLDFGIAKAALAAEQRPEDFKGKLEYMAPEQACMEDVDRRADVFSVGVMLWEALARRRLYKKGDNKLQLLVEGQLPDVLSVAPSAPKRLAAICGKAMAHDPDARYATADAMADDLEEWLGSTTQHVSARDVGSYVAEKFESTRAKIRTAIEAQLTLFRSLPEHAPDTIPLSRLPVTEIPTGDYSDLPANGTIPPGMMPPPFPSNPPPNFGAGGGPSNGSWSHPPPDVLATGPQLPQPNHLSPLQTHSHFAGAAGIPPKSKSGLSGVMVAVMAIGAVALVAIAVAVASRAKGKQSASPASPSSSVVVIAPGATTGATTTTPPPAVEEAQIDFTIRAAPPESRIFVDGKPLASNPAIGKRPRDGAMHLLRIEAPGYEPREESLAFDRSVLISIELRPSAPSLELGNNPGNRFNRNGRRLPTPTPRPHSSKALDSENPYQP